MKAFIVIYFASFIGLAIQAEWSYDDQTQWPGVCNSGLQQSPIDIITRDALVDVIGAHIRGPLVFQGYESVNVTALNTGYTLFQAIILNNFHYGANYEIVNKKSAKSAYKNTKQQIFLHDFEVYSIVKVVQFDVKWNADPDETPLVSGGPLRGNYTFLQFHLHWLSEHAIDGMKYPLEIHMVHVKTGLTLEEALLRPDGVAVIGVFGQVYSGGDSEHALEQIMPVVPSLVNRDEKVNSAAKIIDITRILSPNPQSFYTYSGSLTTPDCYEAVTWIVMDQPIHLSDAQYSTFSKVDVGGIKNYRSLQQANRVVYRSVASRFNTLPPSAFSYLPSNLLQRLR